MLHRAQGNPILTRADVPAMPAVGPDGPLVDPSSVFNPGALAHQGTIQLLLRVQARSRTTHLVAATSADGRRFRVAAERTVVRGLAEFSQDGPHGRLYHLYDPRLTRVAGPAGDEVVALFAADFEDACRIVTARGPSLDALELVGVTPRPSRNAVLFPERLGGRWLRLERPNDVVTSGGVASGDTVVLAESDDLVVWREVGPVFRGRWRYWDELIGSGPPPVRTRHGWLHLYHGVATHFAGANLYQAGAVLLDGEDPTRVLGRTWDNLLEPREPWELTGQVPGVVFPSGWVVREPDGSEPGPEGASDDAEALVYYGAADTVVGLATARVGDLVAACGDGAE